MAKSKKSHNSNIVKSNAEKVISFKEKKEEITGSLEFWHTAEVREELINWLYQRLKEWLKKDNYIVFEEFLDSIEMTNPHFYKYTSQSPKLKELHKYALQKIGIRRERMATLKENDWNPGIYALTMRHYSYPLQQIWLQDNAVTDRRRSEDRKHQKELAELRMQENNAAADLLKYFMNKDIQLPELKDDKANTSSSD